MSFGFGVGDCITCVTLAHKVWRNCRDAPEDFRVVSAEVASLELVLNDVKDAVGERELSQAKHNDLNKLVGGCSEVLTELELLLDKYKSLGTQSRRTWDRMKWGNEQIEEIRLRLVSNTGLLTSFNVGLLGSSQARVEKLLRQLVTEHQSGLREDSIISSRAMDSIEDGDETVWSQIGRELEDLGITSTMIKEHRVFITTWIKNALQNGEFEEREPHAREAASSPSSGKPSDFSSGEHWYDENSRRLSLSSDPGFESARSPALVPLFPALLRLVECGTKAVVRLNECQSSIKGVPKSLRDILRDITIELPLLLHTFVQTKKIAEAGHYDEATQVVLLPLVQGCHSQVVSLNETLIKILPRGDDLSWRRGLKALFNLREEKKIQQIIELLRKYERMMVTKHSSLVLDKEKDAELAEVIDQYEKKMVTKHSSSVPDKESEFDEEIDRRPGIRSPFQTQTTNLPEHVEDKDVEIAEAIDQYERKMAMKHSSSVSNNESELVEAIDRRPGERPPFQTQISNLPDHIEDPIRRLIMAELAEFKREQRERPGRKKLEQDTSDLSVPLGSAELNSSARSHKPPTLEPGIWYRLTNQIHGYALDVVNDGGAFSTGRIEMARVQNVSGQYWQLQRTLGGLYILSTLFLGPRRRLDSSGIDDLSGIDKNTPYLGHYLSDIDPLSDQYWSIEQSGSNRFRLKNPHSYFLDTRHVNNQVCLSQGDCETQCWTFTPIRLVAPDELPDEFLE